MKSIHYFNRYGREENAYTNDDGSGLFELRDGALKQLQGTGQFHARDLGHLLRQLGITRTQLISSRGWGEDDLDSYITEDRNYLRRRALKRMRSRGLLAAD